MAQLVTASVLTVENSGMVLCWLAKDISVISFRGRQGYQGEIRYIATDSMTSRTVAQAGSTLHPESDGLPESRELPGWSGHLPQNVFPPAATSMLQVGPLGAPEKRDLCQPITGGAMESTGQCEDRKPATRTSRHPWTPGGVAVATGLTRFPVRSRIVARFFRRCSEALHFPRNRIPALARRTPGCLRRQR